ncbi:MAG: hypothetical protein ACRCYV_04205 [Aeromonas sp.]
MPNFTISPATRKKLTDKHRVTTEEIDQAFANRDRALLYDDREEHQTDPRTQWFIAETDYGRLLKVCFIYQEPTDGQAGKVIIKTAYTPTQEALNVYLQCAPLLNQASDAE